MEYSRAVVASAVRFPEGDRDFVSIACVRRAEQHVTALLGECAGIGVTRLEDHDATGIAASERVELGAPLVAQESHPDVSVHHRSAVAQVWGQLGYHHHGTVRAP